MVLFSLLSTYYSWILFVQYKIWFCRTYTERSWYVMYHQLIIIDIKCHVLILFRFYYTFSNRNDVFSRYHLSKQLFSLTGNYTFYTAFQDFITLMIGNTARSHSIRFRSEVGSPGSCFTFLVGKIRIKNVKLS